MIRPSLAELARHPLSSYESSTRADSSLQRAFAEAGVEPQVAMTARDANLIKTCVRAGLGAGLLAETAIGRHEDGDLCLLPAPEAIPECIRRVLEGNQEPVWPTPPTWREPSQPITV